mgnify:CR=1 FL=1
MAGEPPNCGECSYIVEYLFRWSVEGLVLVRLSEMGKFVLRQRRMLHCHAFPRCDVGRVAAVTH